MVDVRWFSGVAFFVACTVACEGEGEGGDKGDGDSGGSSMTGGSSNGGSSGSSTGGGGDGGAPDGGTSGGGTSGGGTSGGGTSGGGTSGGGTSGGGTSGGGNSGGGTGGTSGTAGSGEIDCSGAFGTPRTVLEMADTSFSGLTLSPDELELIYSANMTGGATQAFYSAHRDSKADAFSDPVGLPELDAACTGPEQIHSGDLSFDGLTFYFTCYLSALPAPTPLRVARRPSLDAPFVLDPEPIGELTAGPSVSRDELEIFSGVPDMPLLRLVRDDTTEPFGDPELAAGLEMLALSSPEIAANGLDIFFSQTTTGGAKYGLATARRSGPGAAFGPPEPVLPETDGVLFGSPAISNDCRSLYFIYSTVTPRMSSVQVMTR